MSGALPKREEGAVDKIGEMLDSGVRQLKVARERVLEEVGRKQREPSGEDEISSRVDDIEQYWITLCEVLSEGLAVLETESEVTRAFGDTLCEIGVKERETELHERLLFVGGTFRALSKCASPVEHVRSVLAGVEIFRKQVIPDMRTSLSRARADRRAVDAVLKDIASLEAAKVPHEGKLKYQRELLEKEKSAQAASFKVISMKLEYLESKRKEIVQQGAIKSLQTALRDFYDNTAAIKEFSALRAE